MSLKLTNLTKINKNSLKQTNKKHLYNHFTYEIININH